VKPKKKPTRLGTPSAKAKAKAARRAARRPQKTGDARTPELEKRLAEALEQQAATSAILKIISSSPTDIQRSLDAVAESAARLCDAYDVAIFRRHTDGLLLVAHHGPIPLGTVGEFILPLVRGAVSSRAVLEKRTIHLADVQAEVEQFPEGSANARRLGYRTLLTLPLLREDIAIGAVGLRRTEARLFSERQVALLETFASQAAIAIENARLFNELEARNRDLRESLEQQTATAEILRVISSSPTDLQPVLDAVAENAARLCEAQDVSIVQLDGEVFRIPAFHGSSQLLNFSGSPVNRASVAGRAVLEKRLIHVHDITKESEEEYSLSKTFSEVVGHRTMLAAPLLREGSAIGAIFVRRTEVRPFSERQIALLQTFANQAVIAIENVRLFTELEEKNRALTLAHGQVTETLEKQTATGEILRTIAQAQTDPQPVFDTIVQAATQLCKASGAAIFLTDGTTLYHPANYGSSPEALAAARARYPLPLDMNTTAGAAILTRSILQVPDIEEPSASEHARRVGRGLGIRSFLSVPMMREGEAVGAINVIRREPGLFSGPEVELLKTFADQAVIAVENVRLFTELQEKNAALTESLEQQTATAEILNAISGSPTDAQPVFEAIARNAVLVCGGLQCGVFRFDGELLHFVAHHNFTDEGLAAVRARFPRPPGRDNAGARCVLERRVTHTPDLEADGVDVPESQAIGRAHGYRSLLSVPMIREGKALGFIGVGKVSGGFTDKQIELLKTFADQAVIAIENVRLFKELEARNEDLTEALEQQTATSEILHVISRSQTDVQPVFDTIVRSAVGLCAGLYGALYRFDGELIHSVARHNYTSEALAEVQRVYPTRPTRTLGSGRAILERAVVHIPDVERDPEFQHRTLSRATGWRSGLFVPMLREGMAIGAIAVLRAEPGAFSESEIELLKTFADQAVIAIENVRLFNELEARNRDLTVALEQKTATGEILRVISSSPTDVQPVFDAIASSAARLCDCLCGLVFQFDGELITLAGDYGSSLERLEAIRAAYPAPPNRMSVAAQAILERRVIAIADAQSDTEHPDRAERAKAIGYRSVLSVPMLRGDTAIGAINVIREEAIPFSDTQIELLKTFADQAVIAIENVRLFKELEGRNRDLTEALEQQTATAEILRVISRSQTDVQPVFDTIVRSAVRLCNGLFSALFRFDGELLHQGAEHNFTPEALAELHRVFPARPTRALGTGRAILERAVVHMPDVEVDPEYQHHAMSRAIGYRSGLWVPMLREGAPIGVIQVSRAEAGPFSDSEIELLKTFADQAVIAVENVRLFKELQARTAELTQSVEKLTALGEVSRAVSSTLDVETVLNTIVFRASQLAGAAGCSIFEYDAAAEQFELRATHNADTAFVAALRAVPLRKGEGLMGRAAEMREPIQIPDITQPGAYESSVRDTLIRFGYHALLSVPLLREDQIIGSLSFNRKEAGEFPPEVVDVLKTFATQSALAIQNARLFREIADKSAQLEAASRHKSEFLANMSHELRTPLNAIIGFSEVLAEGMFGEINEKQTEYLQDILESGRHLLSLINDILDLSKIEAGRMELELSDFHLPSALENALILVRERASRRGIKLSSTIDERLGMIGGDERKVKQVLLNLLSNALKFTPEGGRIDVGAQLHDHVAEVSVADTGIGIAPADQDAVFEEFRQVGAADKKSEGTGLGLALSRKFIELHGGRIWVQSQVGAGSTFTFTLPLTIDEQHA